MMIDDARLRVVICEERFEHLLPASRAFRVICVDRAAALIDRSRPPIWRLPCRPTTWRTSSTPRARPASPRGRRTRIGRVIRAGERDRLYPDRGRRSRSAQASNSSFDASTFEIWGALLAGAEIVVIDKDVALAPQEFARELRERRITTLFLTTALFNQMSREAPGCFRHPAPRAVRRRGGRRRCVRRVLRDGRPARLLHVYGPDGNDDLCHLASGPRVPAVGEHGAHRPRDSQHDSSMSWTSDSSRFRSACWVSSSSAVTASREDTGAPGADG